MSTASGTSRETFQEDANDEATFEFRFNVRLDRSLLPNLDLFPGKPHVSSSITFEATEAQALSCARRIYGEERAAEDCA